MDDLNIEALYLHGPDATSFAMLHRPLGNEPSAVGVLFCPSFGWDELCIHRSKWRWAQALVGAGHSVLRFDLPGTGDSAGRPTDPDQVPQWLAAVRTGAEYLRANVGVQRVVALGIGLGGLLAYSAAADAPIDDLILWALPTTGSRLVRELRAAARIGLVTELDREAVRPFDSERNGWPDPLAGGFLDECGQIVTGETVAGLDAIDLAQLPLEHRAERHALVFVRSRSGADQQLLNVVRDSGLQLTVSDGDEFSQMMQYVQRSQPPTAAINASLRWLEPLRDQRSPLATAIAPVTVSATLELDTPQVATGRAEFAFAPDPPTLREQPVTLAVNGELLRGIVCEPGTAPDAELPCAVFLSGSSDRRLGPNRLWVTRARRWAAMGLRSVRIDMVGVGDSSGDERRWDNLWFHHEPQRAVEAQAVLDAIQAAGLGDRFVLTGFCSGAVKSYRLSATDRRIDAVFAINLPFFFATLWNRYVRDWWVVDWQPKPGTASYRVAIMRALQATLATLRGGWRLAQRFGPRALDPAKQVLTRLSRRGSEVVVMVRPELRQLSDLTGDPRRDRIADLPHVKVVALPSNDARFRPVPAQAFVAAELDAALGRLLARKYGYEPPLARPVVLAAVS